MASNLFKNTMYLNKNFNFIKGTIREFDMKSAGLNIIKSLKLLPEKTIKELEQMPKMESKIKIGIMQRNNRQLAKDMLKGFEYYRERFIKENNIESKDILSIKKDAIFLINKGIQKDTFDYVVFDCKNRYTSYYYFNGLEFYFNSMTRAIDVKGISDKKLKKHNKYILKFLRNMFYYIELGNSKESIRYLKKFADKYRHKELPVGYYREFNSESAFKFADITLFGGIYTTDLKLSIDDVDIFYNYNNVILNIAKLVYK